MTDALPDLKNNAITKSDRLYYLDWLRIFAMLSIFLFHNARPFNFESWYVNNSVTTTGASVFVDLFSLWMMPLFFVLSGAAVYYSLKRRTSSEFVKERTLRIALPWIVLGMFIVAPPQVYLERLTSGEFSGNIFQFYGTQYFNGFYAFDGNFAWMGLHLWYLMFLFAFSLITLPLFSGKNGTGWLARLAARIDRPWVLPFLIIPIGLAGLLADAAGLEITRQMGSWDILTYLVFFIYGYFIFSTVRIRAAVNKYWPVALTVAVVLSVIHLVFIFGIEKDFYGDGFDLRFLISWSWIIAFLGIGNRFLNFTGRFLNYANEAVLPFYILHQTVIVVIGYYVLQWDFAIIVKYLLISAMSFVAIVVLYHFLVKRFGVLRFLFGMRPRRS